MVAYTYDRAISYVAIGWTLTTIGLFTVVLRLYSRIFLTRSVGSDDFAIFIATCLMLEGTITDTISYTHGMGHHISLLNPHQIAQSLRWTFIDWIVVFIAYFFIRASVMLFVLRLLPPTKTVQQKIILIAFFLNFAITIIACVSFGVNCIPFRATYEHVPNAKCLSPNVIVSTQYLNGILACIIDIATALIPQFLLWHVRIHRTTKIILNTIFALGLITAAMSIGRVATTSPSIWKSDFSWRVMPANTFSMVEEQCGITFASCPAIRQLCAYRRRVGSFLPRKQRQYPNADFVKMWRKINMRDVFWYRKPSLVDGRVMEARPVFQRAERMADEVEPRPSAAEASPLDVWVNRVKKGWLGRGERSLESEQLSITGAILRQKLSLGLIAGRVVGNPRREREGSDEGGGGPSSAPVTGSAGQEMVSLPQAHVRDGGLMGSSPGRGEHESCRPGMHASSPT